MHASVGQSGMETKIMVLTILFHAILVLVIPFGSIINNIESHTFSQKTRSFPSSTF